MNRMHQIWSVVDKTLQREQVPRVRTVLPLRSICEVASLQNHSVILEQHASGRDCPCTSMPKPAVDFMALPRDAGTMSNNMLYSRES